jgi:predicted MPP superfamily phosphohydrolase
MPTLLARAKLSRRQFFALSTGALAAASLGEGFMIEPNAIEVTRHNIPVPGLAPELAGLRIACVSDVHLHDREVHVAAETTATLVARERPDVVVLVGDICNRREDLAALVRWAAHVRGTRATFATLGNWEHDAGIDRRTAERAYGLAGIELLYNSHARVRVGTAGLTFVGIDDPVLGEPDVAAALSGVAPAEPSLWVLHAPGFVDGLKKSEFSAPPRRPAAILTGHTHGGQIRLPFYTPFTPEGSGRFVAGWYRDTLAPLYVCRGIGTVYVSARLFCRPELPVFTLRAT